MYCANCDAKAFYVYQITKGVEVLYCGKHLPKFLESRRKAGLLKTTEALAQELSTAVASLSGQPVEEPKIEEPVIEEPKIEEPTVEEPQLEETEEAPKTKKKKKAAEEPSEE